MTSTPSTRRRLDGVAVSPDAYQAEVVWLLQWEEEKRGGPRKRVEMVAEKASSACAVS